MAEPAVMKEVKLTLRLEPNMEIEACDKASAVAESMNMPADKVDEVRMAVVEACINAIEHSRSRDGTIQLTISVLGGEEPETLRIVVSDRGIGFDPDKVVEPSIEDKLHAVSKRGWGLKIIEGLMDTVEVQSSAEGTSVIMSKSR